jgi:hypothetical protein
MRFFRQKTYASTRFPQDGKHSLLRSHVGLGDQINGSLVGNPVGLIVQVSQDAARRKGRRCRRPQNRTQRRILASRDTLGNPFILICA